MQGIRIGEFNTPEPTYQANPEEPKMNTFSNRDMREAQNPTQDTAQAEMAVTAGQNPNTNLANSQSTGNSVFAERDRDQSIEDAGILARVLAGKLA